MGVAQRILSWVSRGAASPVAGRLPEKRSDVLVSVGRESAVGDSSELLEGARVLAAVMFGKGLVRAPAAWRGAPLAGIVTPGFSGFEAAGSADSDGLWCVPLAPGWAHGVLEQLSPRFVVFETAAFFEGVWAGALEPGGEHLLDEILTLVSAAQERHLVPLLLVTDSRQEGLASWGRLRSAVPAVVDAETVRAVAEGRTAPSALVQGIFDYWLSRQHEEGRG